MEAVKGDSSDWLELLNLTFDLVDLDGWYLTDDDAVARFGLCADSGVPERVRVVDGISR